MTRILPIQSTHAIQQALQILSSGGIVGFPTDTVYGIAVDAFNQAALEALLKIKQKPTNEALPVLIGSIEQLPLVALEPLENLQAMKLARAFWPGAVTLIFEKLPGLSDLISPLPTVGVRIPACQPIIDLLVQSGPLAVTSANRYAQPNPTSAAQVLEQMGSAIDLLLDGGETPVNALSTVVDCSRSERFTILREGCVTESMIRHCLNDSL